MVPITNKAYELLHEGVITLSQIEANGMCVDKEQLQKQISKTSNKIKYLYKKLRKDEIYQVWKKTFGSKTNLGSHSQLGKILFGVLKYKCAIFTKTGKPKTDINVLESMDIPFIQNYLLIEKLKKANATYLKGILKECVSGKIHPVFNLHLAQTYRSSSDSPNFQNIPIRNPETSQIIRECFIARPNHRIVEIDYSGIEVHAACWYHKDPVMIDYICNPEKDMHRDMAMQCYMLDKQEMTPINNDVTDIKRIHNIRYCGKNMFVFPQFYGDYYLNCCQSLWGAIKKLNLHTRDGLSLIEHLKKKGIYKLGNCTPGLDPEPRTFEKHIQEVEYDFWNNRFKVYGEWRKKWYNNYKKTGRFKTLTGFQFEGYFRKNEVINYPVQGVAFHCLLWSLIQIQKQLNKYKMKSLIVGQIHDSIVADVHKDELNQYIDICKKVMTEDVKKHWDFIITPINIEIEVTPVNGNWFQKEKWKK